MTPQAGIHRQVYGARVETQIQMSVSAQFGFVTDIRTAILYR